MRDYQRQSLKTLLQALSPVLFAIKVSWGMYQLRATWLRGSNNTCFPLCKTSWVAAAHVHPANNSFCPYEGVRELQPGFGASFVQPHLSMAHNAPNARTGKPALKSATVRAQRSRLVATTCKRQVQKSGLDCSRLHALNLSILYLPSPAPFPSISATTKNDNNKHNQMDLRTNLVCNNRWRDFALMISG